MKKKLRLCLFLLLAAVISVSVFSTGLTVKAASQVLRNTAFTSAADMAGKLGSTEDFSWSPVYLTDVENYYWTFCDQNELGGTDISLNLAKNAYRNLEMLLDDGYKMDYKTLSSYCEEYLAKKNGSEDAFYKVLKSCLDNPYLLNRPAAEVTATTYNGRDYSAVFDAAYYYNNNPDLQQSIGNNPSELLRQFVEQGINQGRQGNSTFNVTSYAAETDALSMQNALSSSAWKTLEGNHSQPVGKFSYSYANYYGKFLNHYEASVADSSDGTATSSSDTSVKSDIKSVSGTYTEDSDISVYTGEKISSKLANQRPLAVMIPTDSSAQPSYGIGNADVLYEVMEEGGISRQMAIIQDWQNLSRIGNLRSCRLYYIYAAKEWDPILIHFGGVAYMKGTIDGSDINNISGTYEYGTGGNAPGAGFFFRTSDRSAPHNAYISSSGILKVCKRLGYSTSLRSEYYNPKHFTFSDTVNTLSDYNSENATTIDLSKVFTYTHSKLKYDASTGLYKKYLHGKAQVDAVTGKQLTFSNVIVQNTTWKKLDKKGYLEFKMLDTTQDGYYFTKGKCIHITWSKTDEYLPTRYYDDNGNEIQLNTGKTYIAVAQDGKDVIYS